MSRIMLGTICGLVYGALSAASMIPLSFPDKTAALTGAFLNRFAIGFVIGADGRLLSPSTRIAGETPELQKFMLDNEVNAFCRKRFNDGLMRLSGMKEH